MVRRWSLVSFAMSAFVLGTLPGFAWFAAGLPGGTGLLGGPPGVAALELRSGEAGPGRSLADLPACETVGGGQQAAGRSQRGAPSPDATRYQVESVVDASGSLAGWTLTASSGGATVRLALPPESAVRGPVGGRIAIAADDGSRSEVRVVDPARGCGALAFESRDVVRSAVLTPDGASVVYHAVGRSDRADRGIWRVEPGAAGSGRQVLPAVRADDSLVAAVGQVWTTRLEVADAGQRLAVESCGAEACRIRIANLERAADADAVLYAGELVGLDDERLLTLRDCDGLACDLVATDLATGLDRRLAANVASAATVALESRLFAVAALQDRGRPVLGVIDAADARTWLARNSIVPDQGSDPWGDIRLLSRGGMPDAGIEAPPGWTAMVTSRGSIVTVDVARIVAGGDPGTDR